DDEFAGAIPVPAELLDHPEQPLTRFDTETHALRQPATKPFSQWCRSALSFHPTPSRVGRSGATQKPHGGSPQADSESLRRPKRSTPCGLPEGAFLLIFRAGSGRSTSVHLGDKSVNSRCRKVRRLL